MFNDRDYSFQYKATKKDNQSLELSIPAESAFVITIKVIFLKESYLIHSKYVFYNVIGVVFMINRYVLSILSVMCFGSTFCDAASAPAPTNAQLQKRIVQLEKQLQTVNNFIRAQGTVNRNNAMDVFNQKNEINDLKSALYNPGNIYDQVKDNRTQTDLLRDSVDKINKTLERTDGIICRIKQVENEVLKNGSPYHSYEPICSTF